LAVVVLCNQGDADPASLARTVSDLYLKDRPAPSPVATLADRPEVKIDPARLDAYVGDYLGPNGFIINLVRDKDHLVAEATGQGALPMYAVSDTAFRLKGVPVEFDFDRPASGRKAVSGTIRQGGDPVAIKRIARPAAARLKAYEGRFHSPELDVTYEITARDGALRVAHPGGVIDLPYETGKDELVGPEGFSFSFQCIAGRACGAFSIDAGRALNVRFDRVVAAKGR
jgi:hypothetical protein